MLHREDLDQLVRIFKETRPDSSVSLEDDEAKYPSFDELRAQKGADVKHLRIINSEVGIRLQLPANPTSGSLAKPLLATMDVTDEADLTFYRAQEFLESKMRPSQYWIGTVLPVASLLIMALSATTLYHHRNDPIMHGWLFALSFVNALAFASLIAKSAFKASTSYLVTLKRQHEDNSFFKRNKDSLIVGTIFFFLGIGATLLVQYLK